MRLPESTMFAVRDLPLQAGSWGCRYFWRLSQQDVLGLPLPCRVLLELSSSWALACWSQIPAVLQVTHFPLAQSLQPKFLPFHSACGIMILCLLSSPLLSLVLQSQNFPKYSLTTPVLQTRLEHVENRLYTQHGLRWGAPVFN